MLTASIVSGVRIVPTVAKSRIVSAAGVLTAVMLLGGSLAGCGSSAARGATITVVPATAELDTAVTVSLAGLPAGSRAVVAASATDAFGTLWRSTAVLAATRSGTASLSSPSAGGSYVGVDPMGLFDLMTPTSASTHTTFMSPRLGYPITLTVTVHGRTVAHATAHRQTASAHGVTERDLRPVGNRGIYGDLFLPAHPTPAGKPAVLVFGGAEGGLSTTFQAANLAAHGYPSLALAYFAEPGLPATLRDVPLEYFAAALRLLAEQPGVDHGHLVVWGFSRGSEAALLLAVRYPQLVHAVIATSPNAHVDGSIPPGGAAWTFAGRPVPAAPTSEATAADPPDAPDSVIPVEQVNGPLLSICGGEDEVWPSCTFSQAIHARRAAHHVRFTDVNLDYPAAGHNVGEAMCYYSATYSSGGTAQANAQALAQAHGQVLAFLAAQ